MVNLCELSFGRARFSFAYHCVAGEVARARVVVTK